MLPLLRTRLALALIAGTAVALELALMRGLAIRFSSHFAGIVISVGLLGFGAAGSLLTLFRSPILRHQRTALVTLALALAAAIPLTWWLAQLVPLNVNFLAWNFLNPKTSHVPYVLLLELLMLTPLALAGAFIGIALMDTPTRISGHYAADLLGSGIGGIALILALNALSTAQALLALTALAFLAALLLSNWRSWRHPLTALLVAALAIPAAAYMPRQPAPNVYKPLTYAKNFPRTKILYQAEGPLGRLDVAAGPDLHSAPQLSLQYAEELPPHVELFVDGDGPSLIFHCPQPEDWIFADFRTAAAPYHLLTPNSQPATSPAPIAPSTTTTPASTLSSPASVTLSSPAPVTLSPPHLVTLSSTAPTLSSPAPVTLSPPHLVTLSSPRVCILSADGGVDIGLALYHHASAITALQLNPQIIHAMNGPLASLGGTIYSAPGVRLLNQEPRGFFASTSEQFDIIQFPSVGGSGAAGSDATQESYLYTTQSLRAMLHHLKPTGILALTRGTNNPPREELRAFDLAAESLRQENLDPVTHLAMVRGAFSCTILLSPQPFSPTQIAALKKFSKQKGFDLCYYPGITPHDANPVYDPQAKTPEYGDYNIVDHNFYFAGPQSLLNLPPNPNPNPTPNPNPNLIPSSNPTPDLTLRENFLSNYLFNITAPTDNQPYFFHSFRWDTYSRLQDKYGQGSHNFLEVSYILLLVSLSQAVLLAILLILLPLAPGIKSLRQAPRKTATLGYFCMLGLGFMLLEMGFVQKLVLYLAHPLYATAVVISSFLVFAGLGSHFSQVWGLVLGRASQAHRRTQGGAQQAPAGTGQTPPLTYPHALNEKIIFVATGIVFIFALGFLWWLDPWLDLTQHWSVPARCLIAALTIAPLAFAMGHYFPMGLKRIAQSHPTLVPWSWAINGFASVVAAAATPLLAMQFGFSLVVVVAIVCYILAGIFFRLMPQPTISDTP